MKLLGHVGDPISNPDPIMVRLTFQHCGWRNPRSEAQSGLCITPSTGKPPLRPFLTTTAVDRGSAGSFPPYLTHTPVLNLSSLFHFADHIGYRTEWLQSGHLGGKECSEPKSIFPQPRHRRRCPWTAVSFNVYPPSAPLSDELSGNAPSRSLRSPC